MPIQQRATADGIVADGIVADGNGAGGKQTI
jgi:hypothetical protein